MPNQQRQQNPSGQQTQKKKKGKTKKKPQLNPQKEHESVLRNLQDMFKDVLDAVLIHAILEECNFVVEKALETLIPLAEAAVATSEKESCSIPSFKDIKDRLSRPDVHGSVDSDDDHAASDEHAQIEEENSFNEYQDLSLELPLLPESSFSKENMQTSDVPFSSQGAIQHRNYPEPIYTTASSDIDRLLVQRRETWNQFGDIYGTHQNVGGEISSHVNSHNRDQQTIQPKPHRTDGSGMSNMGNQESFFSYYKPSTGAEVTNTQSRQAYLTAYYGDTFMQEPGTLTAGGNYWYTHTDPRLGFPHRLAPSDNKHRSNTPKNTGTVQTGRMTAQTPSWPKKKSQIVRHNQSPKQHVVEVVEPLPRGKVLCLLRGLPGSGKSTLARKLLPPGRAGLVISTDDFFIQPDGTYKFSAYHLEEAHQSSQQKAKRAMEKGLTPVIIDNTNTQLWEMKPYVRLAATYNYQVEIREPITPWRNKVAELARKNTHGVPADKIASMQDRYDKLNSVDDILHSQEKNTKRSKSSELLERREVEHKLVNGITPRRESVALSKMTEGTALEEKNSRRQHDTELFANHKHKKTNHAEHDVQPLPPKQLEENMNSEQNGPQSAGLYQREHPRRGSKEGIDSSTDSNLSVIQDVVTSIPIASCLRENVSSFQNKLSELSNYEDLYKSSGSDDILPKSSDINAGEILERNNGVMKADEDCAKDLAAKVKTDAEKVGNNVRQNIDDAKKRRDVQVSKSERMQNADGSSIDPPSMISSTGLVKESNLSTTREAVKFINNENGKKRENSPLGVSDLAMYLTPSEPDDDPMKLVRDPITSSERCEYSRNEERLVSSEKQVGALRISARKSKASIQLSCDVSTSNDHPQSEQRKTESMEPYSQELSMGVSGPAGTFRGLNDIVDFKSGVSKVKSLDKCRDSPTKSTGQKEEQKVEDINVDSKHAATSEGNSQDLLLCSEWEVTGARPKVKRAISQPIALISSEEPGPHATSPIGESYMQFHSLATVPRTKKRTRRALTPFGKRSLAPSFSVPALQPLEESVPPKGNSQTIAPVHQTSDASGTKQEVREVIDPKLAIVHPSDESDGVTSTQGVQEQPELLEPCEMKPVNSEQLLHTKDQPIRRKVARPSKPPSTPFLSEEARQMAMNQNWSSGAIKREVVSPQKLVYEKGSTNKVEVKHQSSQTDPSHFKFLQKVSSTHKTESPVAGHLSIKKVSQRVWTVDDADGLEVESKQSIPYRRKIDQSSMTENIMDDTETNVIKLHSIFPLLAKKQIKDILQDCHGNIEWASEILVELNNETNEKGRSSKNRKRNRKKTASAVDRELPNETCREENASQTSKVDLLILRVINDGTQLIDTEKVPDVRVVVPREWIPVCDGAVTENHDKSNNSRFIEAETMASLDEEMPQFDEQLAKLLQTHLDVPYVEVCELLERNRGNVEQTERDLQRKCKNEERETRPSVHLNFSKDDETSGKENTGNKGNCLKNVGSSRTTTKINWKTRLDKKPKVIKKQPTTNQVKDEEAASFSDQDVSNYQRGRPFLQSDRGQSEGGPHQRRSRSVPRKRSGSPYQEKNKSKDVKPLPEVTTKKVQEQLQRHQKPQNVNIENKDTHLKDEGKQPKPHGRAGLGKHLDTKNEDVTLPNRLSFQDLKMKQHMEDKDQVASEGSSEMELNHKGKDESKNWHIGAAAKEKGRATPSDILDEEGKGVPARFHEGMTFQLDMAFALQLQEIFGSVGYNIDTDVLSEDDLTISVNLQLAKTIHSAWSQSFQQKFEREEKQLLEMMKQDEEFAKQLQQEEERKNMVAMQKRKEKKYLGKSQLVQGTESDSASLLLGSAGLRDGGGTETFRDIMAVEMAEELGRQMQKEDALSSGSSSSMAVNLRRQELRQKYPGADKSWLENIFMSFNFDFEATVWHIDTIIQEGGPPQNVYSGDAAQRLKEKLKQDPKEQSDGFQLVQNKRSPKTERRPLPPHDDDDEDLKKPDKFQSINHPDYHDYRAEANQHYQQRKECFMKASEAFRKGQMSQAAYYSQQGHKHTALLQQANERASEVILANRNREQGDDTIDLHGLHADEAVHVLERTIGEKLDRIKYSSPFLRPSHQLHIITGRGNHSKGGVARVKPAVQRYLQKKGFKWTQINEGMLRINLA